MHDLGAWVIEQACVLAATWEPLEGEDPIPVHVNVASPQLRAARLPKRVAAALRASGLPPERLVLEIGETAPLAEGDPALAVLGELRALGVRLAVDVVGSGFSSLTHVLELPVDVLKVDRRFVAGVGEQDSSTAALSAAVGIGTTLDLTAIAEGVETSQQRAALTELGVTAAQGFLWSAPLPARAFGLLVRAGRVVPGAPVTRVEDLTQVTSYGT